MSKSGLKLTKAHGKLLNRAISNFKNHAASVGLGALAFAIVRGAAHDAAYRSPADIGYDEALLAEQWLRGDESSGDALECRDLLLLAGLDNQDAGEIFAILAASERPVNILQRFSPEI